MIKFILLGFLNYAPMTGYDLKQTIDRSSGHFWHAHHSQIYTTLRQMENEGLIASRVVEPQDAPDHRRYTLTNAGRTALATWLDRPLTDPSPVKEQLLVPLFFSAGRDPDDVQAELRVQRARHQEVAATYHALTERLPDLAPEEHGLERDRVFWRLTLKLGLRYEAMYIAWFEHAVQTIETL